MFSRINARRTATVNAMSIDTAILMINTSLITSFEFVDGPPTNQSELNQLSVPWSFGRAPCRAPSIANSWTIGTFRAFRDPVTHCAVAIISLVLSEPISETAGQIDRLQQQTVLLADMCTGDISRPTFTIFTRYVSVNVVLCKYLYDEYTTLPGPLVVGLWGDTPPHVSSLSMPSTSRSQDIQNRGGGDRAPR